MPVRVIACVNADGNLAGFQPPKADLQRFAALTIGGTVIMGRKTWEALPPKARPLPHRENVIVTRADDYEHHPDATCYTGATALRYALSNFDGYPGAPDAWVIGGGEIYAQALPLARFVYLSRTADLGGSVPFPLDALAVFSRLVRQDHGDHVFEIWRRA